jgi:C1A family cysteine protease
VARRTGKRSILSTLLVAVAMAVALAAPAVCLAAGGSLAPASPAFLRYLDRSAARQRLGLAPAPLSSAGVPRTNLAPITARYPDKYVTAGALATTTTGSGETSAAYDLRDAGKLSLIRDQGRWGTCWAFASLASLESSLLPGVATDYSENNLAQRSGFALGYDAGGNSSMAAAYLLRWDGPVAEADDPYAPYSGPNASPPDATVRAHVHEVLNLPARKSATDNADLKWAVTTYGAVYTTMYWTSSAYRVATASYYYAGTGSNHAVDIVGWDDAYPASSFAATPAGPGAFLVRNSWGTGFGLNGYFWVSYYDTMFARQSAVFAGAEAAGAGERIYQHDPLGWVASYRPPSAVDPATSWFAAAYTPAEGGTLTAAGFYATAPGATYEVRVAGSVAGVQTAAVAASGTLAAAGYHTVTLDSPVTVTTGQPFVVAVKLTTPGYNFPVAVERPFAGYADATAAAGQSYVSGDGASWTDMTTLLAGTDVCLKGYGLAGGSGGGPTPDPDPTVGPTPEPPTPAAPAVTVRDGSVKALALARVAFRLTDPDRTATADVRLVLETSRGKVLRSRTLHDVHVGSRHIWRVRAPSRRGLYVVAAHSSLDAGEVSATATGTLRVR